MAPPSQKDAIMKMALFVFFVFTRALHPMLIDLSKTDGVLLYAKNTPIVMNKVLTVILMNIVAYFFEGMEGVKQCWKPQVLKVFGMLGIYYAFGDFLEMQSMSDLDGGVYQVLLQTKLLITALMLWWIKGNGQTSLQWHVLFAMFLATSAFVLVDQSSGSSGGTGKVPLFACFCTMLKVAVSCYVAVISEKYLKEWKELSIPAKISALSFTWTFASLLGAFMEPTVRENGFFAHWDSMTWILTWSFVIKTVSTMYLLKILDSIQKNIGEALAVIVIYSAQVTYPGFGKSFDLSVFLLALLVVILVKSYLIAPKNAVSASKDVKLVALKPEGP